MKNITFILALGVVAASISGCSSHRSRTSEGLSGVSTDRPIPGVVEYVWEEPMVDVIDVPPGLDPEGHYYRPSHQEIIEIRQGRWQYYGDKR